MALDTDVTGRVQAHLGVTGRPFDLGILGRAFSGLTPQLVALVLALIVCRVVGMTALEILYSVQPWPLLTWAGKVGSGVTELIGQTLPMLLIIVATANLGPQQGWQRTAALSLAVVASAGIGTLLRAPTWILEDFRAASGMVLSVWSRYALLGGLLTIVGEFYRRDVMATAAAQQAELDRMAFEREMTVARLQALHAQIEPHFLFNTLNNVRRLYVESPAAGRTMLESLMRYLEGALPAMRHDETTLERDAEMVRAYLLIQQLRMGERLSFEIDIPRRLCDHRVPSMMLLTLVENAIKHGLNPLPKGGSVRISARAEDGQLRLVVSDTGVGFGSAAGSGTGLANIAGRLAAGFDGRAALSLENNEQGGATAMITLPLEWASGGAGPQKESP